MSVLLFTLVWMLAWLLDWTGPGPDRTHGRGPDPCHGPVQQSPMGLTAHTRVKPTMCLRQAGAIADIGFFTVDNLHRILFLPDNTKSRPRDCNGDSSIHTGRSGWWRAQLFTGPAVKVSRDARHPLKAQFYEWLNNSDNNGGLTLYL